MVREILKVTDFLKISRRRLGVEHFCHGWNGIAGRLEAGAGDQLALPSHCRRYQFRGNTNNA